MNDEELKIHVQIGDKPLLALIDTGSSHNFIKTATAHALELAVSPRPGMKFAVANGDHLPSTGVCEQVLVFHGAYSFQVNLFVIPLVRYEVILGVSWLSTLGPIWWDFSSLTMQFCLHGKPVSWPPVHEGRPILEPEAVLQTRINRGTPEILVRWNGLPQEDASCEKVSAFRDQFPSFKLDGQEGSDDAFWGRGYQRRSRKQGT